MFCSLDVLFIFIHGSVNVGVSEEGQIATRGRQTLYFLFVPISNIMLTCL